MELNTINWKPYKISDLFIVSGTATTKLNELKMTEGNKHYVTTKSINNGVDGLYGITTEKGNVLTIDSAVVGKCFYQEEEFAASEHVEKLTPLFKMNKEIAQFIQTILNLELYKYSYSRKRNKQKINNCVIYLPTTIDDTPDFHFMENYIKSLQEDVDKKIEEIKAISIGGGSILDYLLLK